MRERDYQAKLIKKLRNIFPGCLIMKNDSSYIQGIPDLIILYEDKWAMLEVKARKPNASSFEPNQLWYLDKLDAMSFAACIFPAVEEELLGELQHTFTSSREARVPVRK